MDLGKGVSFLRRTTKAKADKEMEWGAGAQRGYVPCLKSLSPFGSHIDYGGPERICGSWRVTQHSGGHSA